MAGRKSGEDNNCMEFRDQEDENSDERRESEWEDVMRGNRAKKAARYRRNKNDIDSVGEMDIEAREEEMNDLKAGLFNVVVCFEGERVTKTDPLKLTQVGEIKYARVLRDGNLLIDGSTEAQTEKAKKMKNVRKWYEWGEKN